MSFPYCTHYSRTRKHLASFPAVRQDNGSGGWVISNSNRGWDAWSLRAGPAAGVNLESVVSCKDGIVSVGQVRGQVHTAGAVSHRCSRAAARNLILNSPSRLLSSFLSLPLTLALSHSLPQSLFRFLVLLPFRHSPGKRRAAVHESQRPQYDLSGFQARRPAEVWTASIRLLGPWNVVESVPLFSLISCV